MSKISRLLVILGFVAFAWFSFPLLKRVFSNPPHGDSWATYDAFIECEKQCDALPKEYRGDKVGEFKMGKHITAMIYNRCECAD